MITTNGIFGALTRTMLRAVRVLPVNASLSTEEIEKLVVKRRNIIASHGHNDVEQ